MKIGKIILLNFLVVLLLSIGVYASGKYIVDDAKVLKQDTINTVEENLGKIEQNTEVTVKFDLVKSLGGKSIDDYAKQYAKDNINGEQYILFVSSIGDKKNKLLVGSKANNILSQADIDQILSLPNNDFKANNFDAGIIKVGKALDEKVTTKAVKTGKAEVVNNDYSTKVEHKTSGASIFGTILILAIIGGIAFFVIRRKINNDYEKRKRKFAEDNNVDSYADSEDNSFRSADMNRNDRTENSYSSNGNNSYNSSNRAYNDQYVPNGHSTVNNTTIINNNNDEFVEGMVVGSILSDSTHHNHHHDYDDDYRESERSYNQGSSYGGNKSSHGNEQTYTSGDWNDNTSSWGSSSDDSSSSWDSSSSSDSSSSWDSGSDSSSSDW
ncbi:TPM domain-containing protein [Clostridium sp.]|uniref:TPM domain-containing protein n=1 Tax=Clostridium sp. TaxID=1506 RepID=UPI00283B50A6|nr:TPM domain-containing protein [Clostridium sp.]MDR3598696.1 TPM domain-containing protein [Clostridium sp.]